MLALGYCQRCARVSNPDEGGAGASDRLVTSYTLIRSLPTSDPEVLRSVYRGPLPSILPDRQGQCRISYDLAMFHERPINCRCRKRNNRHQTAEANQPMPPRPDPWNLMCNKPSQLGIAETHTPRGALQVRWAQLSKIKSVRLLLPDELAGTLGVPAE
jgi:hypothetical protein